MTATPQDGGSNAFVDRVRDLVKELKTPLQVLGLVVVVVALLFFFVLRGDDPTRMRIAVIGSLLLLGLVVITLRRPAAREITPLSSQDDLPGESERQCWIGRWQCRWSYRNRDGELLP